jgi:hypothetical protein
MDLIKEYEIFLLRKGFDTTKLRISAEKEIKAKKSLRKKKIVAMEKKQVFRSKEE